MTADGDLVDDHVPPDENDGTSGNGPSADPPPVNGAPDDTPDGGQDQDPPVNVPRPEAERPTVPLRNLRAFDRRPAEDEPDDIGLDDTGPDDRWSVGTRPDDAAGAERDQAETPSPDVPPPDAGWSDTGWSDTGWSDAGWPDSGWPDDVATDAETSDLRDHGIEPDAPTIALPIATDPIPADAPTTVPPDRVLTDLALNETGDGDGGSDGTARSPLRSLIEWVVVIVGALVVATIIKTFLFQAFWIPSDSMLPTLEQKDRVLVNKLSYDLHDVHRGDVIVFERPPGETEKIKDLIKRVIATEGDTLTLENGKVLVNGKAVDEPYLPEGAQTVNICAFTGTVKVPEDHVFVMGDNRENSKDSRCFGPIDEDLIVGRAFVRVWPLSALGSL